jgi:DNA polymerase I
MPETLYLIDGHALAYRTYFALTGAGGNTNRWITANGEPTAGVFGFVSVLLRLIEQDRPDYLMVAFDVGKTFRDEIFSEYKGTREKMPDDLRTQLGRMRELVDKFNIPRLEMEGYEADDVLGSIAKTASEQGLAVKIITGDKDLLQLVTDRVVVSLPGRRLAESRDYYPADVMEVMGVRPDQIVDYKAMVGDPSDNIPGVRGIGKKSAEKFLAAYHTLDGVYENLDQLKPGQRTKMEESKENAYMSQKLAQIVTDLNIPLDLEKGRLTNFNPGDVQALFRELEFRTLMNRLVTVMGIIGMDSPPDEYGQMSLFGAGDAEKVSKKSNSGKAETIIVDSVEKLQSMVKELSKAKMIAFDTETTGINKMKADLVGISLSIKPHHGYYIPVGHDVGQQLPLEQVITAIRPAMTNKDIQKIGHNLKYDYVMLYRYGLDVSPLSFDTLLAEWLRDPGSRSLGLKNLSWVRLGIQMTEIKELIGTGKKQITMAQVPIEKASPYAVADAEIVMQLYPLLKEDLENLNMLSIFESLEIPLIKVLSKMEMTGIKLDQPFLEKMSAELTEEINKVKVEVFEEIGEEFNLNSTQQLSKALFEQLGLTPPPGTKKNASGYYSTAAAVLEELGTQSEVVKRILVYREYSKLKSTYLDALPNQIAPKTGRVHTSYSQAGSVTGRLSSNDPNLQNIPIRTEQGKRVREGFIAGEGKLLLAIDYSQVELRVAAHMAKDAAMMEAFQLDQDIHAATAAAIYDVPIENVQPSQRRHAKAINFGLIYGMSAFGLTRTTDLTLAEAEDFVKTYFDRFTGVKKYLEETKEHVLKNEYVETLMGRRRYFAGLATQTNQLVKNRQLRESINSPIQGTAADIMKLAMISVSDALDDSSFDAKILLQVHDELVLEVPIGDILPVAKLVKSKMESSFQLLVPLKTDAKAGSNWGKMKPLSDFVA